jgi:sugar lactone lactonase YvrE
MLCWLDLDDPAVFTLEWDDPSSVRRQALPARVSCLARTHDARRFVAASECELGELSPFGALVTHLRIEDPGLAQLNDGKCDPRGRLWVGSAGVPRGRPTGRLHRIAEGRSDVVIDGLGMSNGLAWSADEKRFFHVDSLAGTIWTWSFDAATGQISNRRQFAWIDPAQGLFDGLAADSDGGVWVAVWGAGEVRRYDSAGRLDRAVRIPTANVSSVAFAGPELDILCITSAGGRGGELALQNRGEPAGAVFACRPGMSGVPVAAFEGRPW